MRNILRFPTLVVVVAAAAVLSGGFGAWAYVFGFDEAEPTASTVEAEPASTTTSSSSTTTTVAPTTTTTLPPMPPAPVRDMPPLPPGGLAQGASGLVVGAYEERLAELRFDPGEVDGIFDGDTRYAVEAVQKLAGRAPTGAIAEPERFLLSVFQWPEPMVPDAPEASRVEVDLDRQVMIVWKERAIELVTTVSTGSGEVFCGGHDGCQYATTPTGRYEFQWRWNGWRDGDLGRMYNPVYFNGGIAVHGYASVPTVPASHGCVRVPMRVGDYFPDLVADGDAIYVVGTQAAPFGQVDGGGSAPATTAPAPTTPPTTPPPTTPPTTKPPPPSTTTTKPPPSTTTTTKPPPPSTTTTTAP